jgi:hypothetical protein
MAAAMRRGPILDVKAKPMNFLDVAQARRVKLKHSSFGFTMNTNYRPKSKEEMVEMDRAFTEAMEEALYKDGGKNLMESLRVIDSMEKGPGPGAKRTFVTHQMTQQEFEEHVKKVKVRFRNEIGTNYKYGGRWHLHGYIYVVHTTMIHLDIQALMRAANAELSAKGLPTLKYGHFGMEKVGMKEYMSKQDLV